MVPVYLLVFKPFSSHRKVAMSRGLAHLILSAQAPSTSLSCLPRKWYLGPPQAPLKNLEERPLEVYEASGDH
jgi:hypothetical protein